MDENSSPVGDNSLFLDQNIGGGGGGGGPIKK